MIFDKLVVGSTYSFRLDADLDGETWDLTGATVTFHLKDPLGAITNHAADVTTPDEGLAKYDSAALDLHTAGRWTRSWKVTQGAVTQETPPIPFLVVNAP